ncbi:MAG: arginine decarboxylase, pyruvoyl-dependent [Gemmatimonadetes bacterium]|nr:arginine decarboxylase, pyruvoyl-dependent [Gemmatimonadota bacterium]NIR78393.1 arginine decarboxylase, pyruvoyl-dependent [Gemmatimonadota bacterium]NIT86997.1 arginine decarboxylase, pyruvoyl-dependent [Gemmatimonadota bacterium]NIU30841.1 arginine decarboxylase, pyruvoyl-dependent [Gemmatimonadota bacterium]NIU35613.1 arginine decarboxylase, pyruvoyl-dependent [Gemmatimonadota bacterium]
MFQGPRLVPQKLFFTTGVGVHREKLTSFEMALRDALIAHHNLVRVSSIFPPGCEIVPRTEGTEVLRPGQVVYCVLSDASTNEPSRRVGSSIGVAIPSDRERYGYISEHHAFGQSERAMGEYAEDLAASMLATVLGVRLDPEEAWDERREQWKVGGHIVDSQNHTVVVEGPEDGRWATTVAAAVFCG